jgi:hypothetical protein
MFDKADFLGVEGSSSVLFPNFLNDLRATGAIARCGLPAAGFTPPKKK